jgi:hypothetical protein
MDLRTYCLWVACMCVDGGRDGGENKDVPDRLADRSIDLVVFPSAGGRVDALWPPLPKMSQKSHGIGRSLLLNARTYHGLAVRRGHGDAVALAGVLLRQEDVPLLVQHVPIVVMRMGGEGMGVRV